VSVIWKITIRKDPSGRRVAFEPQYLRDVCTGDEVFWANDDTEAHWPGLKNESGRIDRSFFMNSEIGPSSISPSFSVDRVALLNYTCSLHPDETGTIQIKGRNGGGGIGP